MNLTIIEVFYFCPSFHTYETAMPISCNSPFPLFLFMLLSRQEPAYSDHLHYPKWICFEVLRFSKKKDPLIPHEKCSKLINSLEQMYIIIGFAFFSLFAPVLVIDYLMSFSSWAFSILPLQKLAPCCANPHFKALCLSAGNKAHRTYYGSLSFPHI